MMYWKHYKRAPVVGLVCALVALAVLVWRPDLPLAYVILSLAVVGTAVGLVYPVTTVSIQNAVPHHQVGIAMGALNFFRSLASAFIVAVLGAILLAGLGVAPERGGRAISVIETVGAAGINVAFVFRWVILLAGLGVAPERSGRAVSVIATVSAAGGHDVAFVFRWVFLAAFAFLALSLLFLILMEERPLRGSVLPADPPATPTPAG
jgi:MFS family permease